MVMTVNTARLKWNEWKQTLCANGRYADGRESTVYMHNLAPFWNVSLQMTDPGTYIGLRERNTSVSKYPNISGESNLPHHYI